MFAKIFFVALFTSMVLAVDYQREEADEAQQQELIHPTARFFAFQTTKTVVTVSTTTTIKTVPSTCAVVAAGITACRRRRRGIEKPVIESSDLDEKIDLFNPSPVQPLETTQVATLNELVSEKFEGLESSSGSPVEVDIVGLQNSDCAGRNFGLVSALASSVASAFPGVNSVSNLASSFASNLTLRFKTTLTATVVVTKTVTSGSKAFTVSNCTPSPFLYATCV